MSYDTTPASSGIALTRKGERYAAEHGGNRDYAIAINRIRREAAAEIDRLIRLIDDLGGDPDLEDDGSAEPTLGWPQIGPHVVRGSQEDGELEWSIGCEGDLELDAACDEPSLGRNAEGDPGGAHPTIPATRLYVDLELDLSDFEDIPDAEQDNADQGHGNDADASFCDAWEGRS